MNVYENVYEVVTTTEEKFVVEADNKREARRDAERYITRNRITGKILKIDLVVD